MDTDRVKNILIVLFSFVVVLLGSLIFINEGRYNLSAAQEAAVLNLLERNDIHFDGEIVRNFSPMRRLDMISYDYDREELAKRFFASEDFVVGIDLANYNYMIYYIDNARMVYFMHDNTISFETDTGITGGAFEETPGANTAEQLAREFVEEIMGMPQGAQSFTHISFNGDWVISFFGMYRGYTLYNDHIRVRVTDEGITSVLFSRVVNNGFTGEAVSIFSGDEALLALMHHLRGTGVQGRIMISYMGLTYFLIEEGGREIGIPAYVFTVVLESGLQFNYLFNAHTGGFITYEIIIR